MHVHALLHDLTKKKGSLYPNSPPMDSSFSWERFQQCVLLNNQEPELSSKRTTDSTNVQNLLVFGYSCKLYKDDDKAKWINSGQHLIPWMGKKELLIDRYDARGYLNDLSNYDPKFDTKRSNNVTKEDADLEELLNKERFTDLNYDSDDDSDSHNLEKEPFSNYSNVNYQYEEEKRIENSDESDDEFKIPTGLNIRDDLILPKSNKLYCIIEKTALFVAQHGAQMEILLKTKQASNSNFNFLSIDSDLNPFYKYLLSEIRNHKYIPKTNNNDIDNESDSDDNYLHPSLLSSKTVKTNVAFNIPSLVSSNQENDSYSQLVKNFKDKFADDIEDSIEDVPETIKQSPNVKIDLSTLIPKPPQDVELIIAKLAQHVAKNGENFESSIKELKDAKFDFLHHGHTYHPYYVQQKIRYLSEFKREQFEKSKNKGCSEQQKLIAFSINVKDNSKKHLPLSYQFDKEETNSVSGSENNQKESETVSLSKEKQLQEERKKKALEFLKMLRKENKLGDSPVRMYGPNLPIENKNINLSPTIEAVTSPVYLPKYDSDIDSHISEQEKNVKKPIKSNHSLLPFTSNDTRLKERSVSPQQKPRRYRSPSPEKNSPKHRSRERKSRKRRHRSRSRSSSKKRSRSRKSRRERKHRHHRRHRRHSSSSRSGYESRSLSSSPESRRHSKSKRYRSHSSRRSRSRSRS